MNKIKLFTDNCLTRFSKLFSESDKKNCPDVKGVGGFASITGWKMNVEAGNSKHKAQTVSQIYAKYVYGWSKDFVYHYILRVLWTLNSLELVLITRGWDSAMRFLKDSWRKLCSKFWIKLIKLKEHIGKFQGTCFITLKFTFKQFCMLNNSFPCLENIFFTYSTHLLPLNLYLHCEKQPAGYCCDIHTLWYCSRKVPLMELHQTVITQ